MVGSHEAPHPLKDNVMARYCKDCESQISYDALRCRSCAAKALWRNPEYREAQSRGSSGCRKAMADAIKLSWSRGDHDGHSDVVSARWKEGVYDSQPAIMRELWSDLGYRAEVSEAISLGVLSNPDLREKFSRKMKEQWVRGDFDGVLNPSKLELSVLYAFELFGVEVVSQYRLKNCRFTYDMYLPEYQTLVEVDGEYWHHSDWAIENGAPERDARKDEVALANGCNIIRIPEQVLKKCGTDYIVEQVVNCLNGSAYDNQNMYVS